MSQSCGVPFNWHDGDNWTVYLINKWVSTGLACTGLCLELFCYYHLLRGLFRARQSQSALTNQQKLKKWIESYRTNNRIQCVTILMTTTCLAIILTLDPCGYEGILSSTFIDIGDSITSALGTLLLWRFIHLFAMVFAKFHPTTMSKVQILTLCSIATILSDVISCIAKILNYSGASTVLSISVAFGLLYLTFVVVGITYYGVSILGIRVEYAPDADERAVCRRLIRIIQVMRAFILISVLIAIVSVFTANNVTPASFLVSSLAWIIMEFGNSMMLLYFIGRPGHQYRSTNNSTTYEINNLQERKQSTIIMVGERIKSQVSTPVLST